MIVLAGEPIGPSCHTGRDTCYFSEFDPGRSAAMKTALSDADAPQSALTTLFGLEHTISTLRMPC